MSMIATSERTAPPRLHWVCVLLLSMLTGSWFGGFWFLRQAQWSKRVHGVSNAYAWAIAYLIVLTIDVPFTVLQFISLVHGHGPLASDFPNEQYLLGALSVLYPVVGFALQNEFEAIPIDLNLSGWMVFFWGPVYLQFWLGKLDKKIEATEKLSDSIPEV